MSTRRLWLATTALAASMLFLAGCESATPSPSPSRPGPASPSPAATSASASTAAPASPTSAPAATPTPTPDVTPTETSPAPAAETWSYRTQNEIAQTLFPPDGRAVIVERDWDGNRSVLAVLDPDGDRVDGWPWSVASGNPIAQAAVGPDNSLYVAVRGEEGIPSHYTWNLHRLSPSAEELAGFPVALPSVSFCDLQAPSGIAYVTCESENDDGDSTGTIVTAIGPDGSSRYPAPVRLARTASVIGFQASGQPVLAIQTDDRTVIRGLAADGSTAWSSRTIAGDAFVDRQGRVRVTRHEFEEDACAPAIRTTYDVLDATGARVAGWPIVVRGWASEPAVLSDGSMVIATAGGRAIRYTDRGRAAAGWPVTVDVSFSCADGSSVVAQDDQAVIAGGTRVSVVAPFGRHPRVWSANPRGAIAIVCPGCTPGSGATVDPVLHHDTFVATYDAKGRPTVVRFGPELVSQGRGIVVGAPGAEMMWLAYAPTGRVWAVTSRSGPNRVTGRLSLVGDANAVTGP